MTPDELITLLTGTLVELGVLVDDRDAKTLEAIASFGEQPTLGVISLLTRTYSTGAEARMPLWLRALDRPVQ